MINVNVENFPMQNVEEIEKKSLSKDIYISLDSFLDFDKFSKNFSLLKYGRKYILLVRVNYKNSGEERGQFVVWKTLGEQITLKNINEDTYLDVINNLQRTILQRLDSSMEKYKYVEMDIIGIQLILYKCGLDVKPKKIPTLTKESFGEQKDLVNVSKLEGVFNKIYPVSDIGNRFGVLLKKEVLNNSVYITLMDGNRVDFQERVNNYSLSDKFTTKMDFYQKKVGDSEYILVVDILGDKEWSVYIYDISGMKIQHVVDKILDSENVCRTMGNVCFYVNKSKGVYKKEISTKFPPIYANKVSGRLSRLAHPDYKFGALDLETYKLNGKSYVYAMGFYTDGDLSTFYVDETLDSDDLIFRCLNSLLIDKYNGYTFYVHNLAGFDIYFILPALNRLNRKYNNKFEYKDAIVFRDDEEIISIKISVKVKTEKSVKVISIKLVDSFKLLSSKLDSLCKTFGTDVKKSYFPYDFVKKQTLFYEGEKPSIEYYENIDLNSYNEIGQHNWSMKDQTLFYLKNDLVSLYEVMDKFIKSIYINYHVHATSSLTISSLSMDIFLRRFYNNNIPLIKEKSIFYDIKESYYGGITEVYKPYGTNLYYYDVNSLYPFAALNPMPGLNCVYVDNINQNINEITNLFGFYYCEIECYSGYLGLLSIRTDNGVIQALGSFKGWYFSEELKFANEHGYKIHVLKGYNFDKSEGVFDKYFNELYSIKCNSKDGVERALAKSKLNNLIGKLGSNIDKYISKIVTEEEFLDILTTRRYRGVKYLDGEVLVTYDKEISEKICEQNDIDYKQALFDFIKNTSTKNIYKEERYNNVSIALASAITAYSRIYINKVKLDVLKKGGSIYYSDTDSLVTDIELDKDSVGREMGKFKLEHEVVEGYFISNKTYCIKNKKGKLVFKNKGVFVNKEDNKVIVPFDDDKDHRSLIYEDFNKLYLGEDVKTFRYESNKNISSGYVNVKIPRKLTLSTDSYTKRTKVFNGGLWVDTKPLILKSSILEKPKNVVGNIKENRLNLVNNILKYFKKTFEYASKIYLYFNNICFYLNKIYSFIKKVIRIITWLLLIMVLIIVCITANNEAIDSELESILELRYNDDYMEEPVDIEIFKNTSYLDRFINYFKVGCYDYGSHFLNLYSQNNCKLYSLYTDSVHITNNFIEENVINHLSSNTNTNTPLKEERLQVLVSILKHHLDEAYENQRILLNRINDSETLGIRRDIIIRDAVNLCRKALNASPITGTSSPIIEWPNSLRHSSPSPIIDQRLVQWQSSLIRNSSPLIESNSPITGNSSILGNYSPNIGNNSYMLKGIGVITENLDSSNSLLDSNAVIDTQNTLLDTQHNSVISKAPLRDIYSPEILKRFGHVWSDDTFVENHHTMKRYGRISPYGISVLEDYNPLEKRYGHVWQGGIPILKDYGWIAEQNYNISLKEDLIKVD